MMTDSTWNFYLPASENTRGILALTGTSRCVNNEYHHTHAASFFFRIHCSQHSATQLSCIYTKVQLYELKYIVLVSREFNCESDG